MSFDDDERSLQDSRPREFYEITHGTTTYRIASGQRDIMYNGSKFIAIPSARSELKVSSLTGDASLELSVTEDHALVQRYLALGGSPPARIAVTVRRMQLTSGEVQQIWIGYVASIAFDGHAAKFLVPSRSQQSMSRKLPTVLVSSTCANVLYDARCRVDQASNTISTTATLVDGRTVKVASVGGNPDQWYRFGRLVHGLSGEPMAIWDQTGNQLTLQMPIVEFKTGDAVQLVVGCDHNITTCRDKFNNVVNYGGLPQRPTRNPFVPTGFGSVEQA